jgi:hypothetical protein
MNIKTKTKTKLIDPTFHYLMNGGLRNKVWYQMEIKISSHVVDKISIEISSNILTQVMKDQLNNLIQFNNL